MTELNKQLMNTQDRNRYMLAAENGELTHLGYDNYPEWLFEDEEIIYTLYCKSDVGNCPSVTDEYNLLLYHCSDTVLKNEQICASFLNLSIVGNKVINSKGNDNVRLTEQESVYQSQILKRINRIHGGNKSFYLNTIKWYSDFLLIHIERLFDVLDRKSLLFKKEFVFDILEVVKNQDFYSSYVIDFTWMNDFMNGKVKSVNDCIELIDVFWITYFILPSLYRSNPELKNYMSRFKGEMLYLVNNPQDLFICLSINGDSNCIIDSISEFVKNS